MFVSDKSLSPAGDRPAFSVRQAEESIEAHFADPISPADIAADKKVSTQSLYKHAGTSAA
ncbi:MAG: hypothetical protein ACJ8DP_09875 [Microvirga sp.]